MHALDHFARRLAVETDVADVAAALDAGERDFVLLDARSRASYDAGHLPGALRLPELTAETVGRAARRAGGRLLLGPGLQRRLQGRPRLAELGRPVKEMLGGYEYWARDGHPIETS